MNHKFLDLIFGGEENSLEQKIFYVSCLTVTLACLQGSFMNFLRFNTEFGFILFFIGICYLIFYLFTKFVDYTKNIHFLVYIITIINFYPIIWILDGGILGTVPYHFPVFIVYLFLSLDGNRKKVAFLSFFIMITFLIFLQYFNPSMFHREQSIHEKILSVYSQILTIFLSLYFLMYIYFQELKSKKESLEKLAKNDPLTGIFNRNHFFEKVEFCLKNTFDKNMYLMMFDIDDFKNLNDKYGHLEGDKVILKVVEIIKNNISEDDFIGRYGGDEFVVFFNNKNDDYIREFCFKIKNSIQSINFFESISMSGGISKYDKNFDMDTFIKIADDKMYEVKRSGKGKVCF